MESKIYQVHRYRDLRFWNKSKDLSVEVYRITKSFPVEERFGIVDQMRRASISIPSNIAEGSARHSNKDFSRFLQISTGSAYELETQMEISRDLGFLSNEDYEKLTNELTIIIKQIAKFRSNCLNN